MTPDALAALTATLKIVLPLLTGGGLWKIITMARDARRETRNRPAEETSSAIAITKELQALAAAGVSGVRQEMEQMREKHSEERSEDRRLLVEAREQLATGRAELANVTRRLEDRERQHTQNEERSVRLMERMRRRIAQLAKVLTDNNLEVPPEILEDDDELEVSLS